MSLLTNNPSYAKHYATIIKSSNSKDQHEGHSLHKCDNGAKSTIMTPTKNEGVSQQIQFERNNLIKFYEGKIAHIQSQFSRTKEQLEISLKNVYKEKIMLLNLISSDWQKLDQYRKKITFSTEISLKMFESMTTLLEFGIWKNLICSSCVQNIQHFQHEVIGKTQKQNKGGNELEVKTAIKVVNSNNPQSNIKGHTKKMRISHQASNIMIVPKRMVHEEEVKDENLKLKKDIELLNCEVELLRKKADQHKEHRQHREHREHKQNKDAHRDERHAVHHSLKDPETEHQIIYKLNQKVRGLCHKVEKQTKIKKKHEEIIQELNQFVLTQSITSLNAKYKQKYS